MDDSVVTDSCRLLEPSEVALLLCSGTHWSFPLPPGIGKSFVCVCRGSLSQRWREQPLSSMKAAHQPAGGWPPAQRWKDFLWLLIVTSHVLYCCPTDTSKSQLFCSVLLWMRDLGESARTACFSSIRRCLGHLAVAFGWWWARRPGWQSGW
jgi:hypothetical protein